MPFGLRGVGFVPTQMNGCVLWLSADRGVQLSGSNVVTWADSSGAGNHFTSTGAVTTRPSLIATDPLLNGQPSITFVSSSAQILTNTSLNVPQPNTAYVVSYISTFNPNINLTLFDSPGTRQTLYAVIGSGPTTGIGAFAGSVKNSTNNVLTVGQPFCAAGVFNGSNSNVYLGTSQPGTSQAAVVGLSAFAAGANSLVQAELFGFAGINFTSGSIAEVIIYQGAHTPQQVSWVFQYLSSKYNPGAWS